MPTEWEWQQAATGGAPDRAFPWGPEFETKRTNTYESELNRTIAAGLYPEGASPVQVLDMAGNLWEWCLNEYETPAQCERSSDGRRVVRGGSWNLDRVSARAACRLRNLPANRFNFVGFRLVCSAPIS